MSYMKMSYSVDTLNLNHYRMGEDGAQNIAPIIAINTCITKLILNYNNFGPGGGRHIAGALTVNTTLTELYIGGNGLEKAELASALNTNRSLTFLDMSATTWGTLG